MPKLTANGVTLDVSIQGTGPATILLIHGLFLPGSSFAPLAAVLAPRYRVITWDLRGQGDSAAIRDGLDLETLAADATAIAEAFGGGRCHVLGFSMGSFIALRLAARRPDLVRSLTLIGTSAAAEDPAKMGRYGLLLWLARLLGPRRLSRPILKILFGKTFLSDPARQAEVASWRAFLRTLPRTLVDAAAASAHRQAVTVELTQIQAPTLVVHGSEDTAISESDSRAVAAAIRSSQYWIVEKTGHAVFLERPDLFNGRLQQFLEESSRSEI